MATLPKAALCGLAFLLCTGMAMAQAAADPDKSIAQKPADPIPADPIPSELLGKWVIRKILPTQGITCWDGKQARSLLGTTIEYRSDRFLWKNHVLPDQGVTISSVEAQTFMQENSGSGGTVDFQQLGITAPPVKQIEIKHPDATIYRDDMQCCAAVPGEAAMMKSTHAIVLNLCGVFYEARRVK